MQIRVFGTATSVLGAHLIHREPFRQKKQSQLATLSPLKAPREVYEIYLHLTGELLEGLLQQCAQGGGGWG